MYFDTISVYSTLAIFIFNSIFNTYGYCNTQSKSYYVLQTVQDDMQHVHIPGGICIVTGVADSKTGSLSTIATTTTVTRVPGRNSPGSVILLEPADALTGIASDEVELKIVGSFRSLA